MTVTFAYKCIECGAEADAKSDQPIPDCPNTDELDTHTMRKNYKIGGIQIKW